MGKYIDLTGKHFGRWTILNITDKRRGRSIIWHCKCECGTEKDVDGYLLRSGQSKSCGCLHKEIVKNQSSPNLKIIPKGTRFGRLTVIGRSTNNNEGKAMWRCKCDCGNEIDVRGTYLRNGTTQSCGCYKREQTSKLFLQIIPTGTKFGKLTVLKLLDERQNGDTVYQCQCECGSIVNVLAYNLRGGTTQSCGCLRSKGEFKIAQLLTENNIVFEKEKIFENCRFKDTMALAKFDFYIDNRYIIEFDGIQHFYIHGWNTEEHFEKIQKYDEIKNQYCKEYNIPIIRIPYTHYDNLCLEDLIPETSKFLVE